MINQVALTGRLTRDIDLRYTQSGSAVATFTLAVDRQFTNAAGERESDFISCVIWRKSAENLSNFTRKGSLIGVEGRIQTRTYDNAQGQRVYVTEVVVDNFALLESRATTEARPHDTNSSSNSFNNQGNGSQQNRPAQGGSRPAAPAGSGNQMNGNQQNNSNQNAGNGASGNKSSNDPFNNPDPFASNGKQIDISDDDLPF
ncbi:single-stranded DNA-binding protein [Lacticaseibacillus zhaodongensis]|uniref:single-stranded DNA-binding protein n=1 Tax=Lacticaseibacillus zhaodongensis TaxID=2668065 RepID=UPI0012D300C2|nr:single-stranded DNA-binding protein [Lacticaseibacillus zhaodongensis]